MSGIDKGKLKKGEIVHTENGRYFVVAVDPTYGPILTRCFRMGDPAKYAKGLPESWRPKV